MSPTAISPRRLENSSSPTRPGTSSSLATWRRELRRLISQSSSSMPPKESRRKRVGTRSSFRCWESNTSSWPSIRWILSDYDQEVFDQIADEFDHFANELSIDDVVLDPAFCTRRRQRDRDQPAHRLVRRTNACCSNSTRCKSTPIASRDRCGFRSNGSIVPMPTFAVSAAPSLRARSASVIKSLCCRRGKTARVESIVTMDGQLRSGIGMRFDHRHT